MYANNTKQKRNAEIELTKQSSVATTPPLDQGIAGASDKIASLEEDLKIMSGEEAEAKRVLEETCAELKDLKRQYDNEVNSAAALKEKLKNATAKIMDLDALIQKNRSSEKQKNDDATKAASIAAEEIQALQLQVNALTAQLGIGFG